MAAITAADLERCDSRCPANRARRCQLDGGHKDRCEHLDANSEATWSQALPSPFNGLTSPAMGAAR